jgi:hypothetical protein
MLISMSNLFATIDFTRSDDMRVAALVLFVVYFVIYPTVVILERNRHARRIKTQLVTSIYKIPLNLTPVDMAYLFSPRVKKSQIYATVIDLVNRGVLRSEGSKTDIKLAIGPRVDNELKTYEKMLVKLVEMHGPTVKLETLLTGETTFKTTDGERIGGSREYVFWWLVRESLRDEGYIHRHMGIYYLKMLIVFGGLWSLFIAITSTVTYRFIVMLQSGEIDLSQLVNAATQSSALWVMVLPVLLVGSFFLLKFGGKMRGRKWVMTHKTEHFLKQICAFREFTRLSLKGRLRFESKELREESISATNAYAHAFGYKRLDS